MATAEETLRPPQSIGDGVQICKVVKAEGKNLYAVTTAKSQQLLVELPAKFRSSIWMKRGGYVLVNTQAFDDRDNKLGGEIENVVGDEKTWRKMPYW
jgi:probable RNA-binding protein EIF1AD